MRSYTWTGSYTSDDGSLKYLSGQQFSIMNSDESFLIKSELDVEFKDLKEFKTTVWRDPIGSIDFELLDRMRAIRSICELGRKVRADAKIKNRQPLRQAYVMFTDEKIQNWISICDSKDEYLSIIESELNIFNCQLIDDPYKFCDINLKANFRVLGPKQLGKQAQALKDYLFKLSISDKLKIYSELKQNNFINLLDCNFVLEDFEVEFVPKLNFQSSSNSDGFIILDTKLDQFLLERGFVADFVSEIQNLRKKLKFDLTDKITLDVFIDPKWAPALQYNLNKLLNSVQATEINFHSPDFDNVGTHKIVINEEDIYILIEKVHTHIKVFMDDLRTTPEGWQRTFNIEQTKKLLLTRQVVALSLDNDLGSLDPKTEGFNVLDFLEELVYEDPLFPIPEITIHSSNSARVISMQQVVDKLNILRLDQQEA